MSGNNSYSYRPNGELLTSASGETKAKYEYELVVLDDECKPNVAVQVATGLLGLAFGVFVAAFVAGRNISFSHRRADDAGGEAGIEDEAETPARMAEPTSRGAARGA